jgi:integration host factor subunit alpha
MHGQQVATFESQSPENGAVGREQLADAVYRSARNLTRLEARGLVDEVLAEIAEAIVRDGRVSLSGFGLFSTASKGERIGRNPKTGELHPIAPRRVVRFTAAIGLRKQVAHAHLADATQAAAASAR